MPEHNSDTIPPKGIRAMKPPEPGQQTVPTRKIGPPPSPQEVRAKLKLSQAQFAELMGVSLRTIQDWEQRRRKPGGSAEALLRIAEQHPEVFKKLG